MIDLHRDDIDAWGQQQAAMLKPGRPLLLQGPVGVGKSTVARAILSAILPELSVFPSPSFPLMIPYETPQGTVCHVDLYRISDSTQLSSLNLDDYFHQARCLIEWPEILQSYIPNDFCTMHLRFHDNDVLRRKVWLCDSPCSVIHPLPDSLQKDI